MLGRAAFIAGRYQESMDAYERNAARGGPSYYRQMMLWAAACSLSGNLESAQELVREALLEHPGMTLANIHHDLLPEMGDSELELLHEGLRKAGLPD